MGLPMMSYTGVSHSALQLFISTHEAPRGVDPYLHNLALHTAHNLRYQHNWSNVRLHENFPDQNAGSSTVSSRPMISGLPPQRLYIHPDEQIELLQKQKDEGKTGLPHLVPEREWVLPSHLKEKWSLRKFGEVFDSISAIPPELDGDLLFDDQVAKIEDSDATQENGSRNANEQSPWRTSKPKRLLLATLDDDSTIVYYIVHDGIVKPRQN